MKKSILTFIFCLSALFTFSQTGIGASGTIKGNGATGYIPKFSAAKTVTNSVLYESTSKIGLGTTSPTEQLSLRNSVVSDVSLSYATYNRAVIFLAPTASAYYGISSFFNDKLTFGRFNVAGNTNGIGLVLEATSGDFTINSDYTSGSGSVDFIYKRSNQCIGIGTATPQSKLDINGFSIRIRNTVTLSGTSDAQGNVGDHSWDDNYIYVKTNSGWKRSALSTF